MAGQRGFFDTDERLRWLSAAGDPLERLAAVVDFELFRPELDAALGRSDRAKGGRPPYDAVMMLRVLVLQTLYTLSDDQAEYQLRDRLSFMRFAELSLHDAVPDAKTIWLFREQLVRAGAFERLFARFDAALTERGYLAMGGQIVDATIVEARRPRLTQAEKGVVKGGGVPEDWKPARTRQIDREGRISKHFLAVAVVRGASPVGNTDASVCPDVCRWCGLMPLARISHRDLREGHCGWGSCRRARTVGCFGTAARCAAARSKSGLVVGFRAGRGGCGSAA